MHRDMNPLWPLIDGNRLLGAVPVGMLHVFCVVSGLLGIGLIARREIFRTGD